jgi:cytidyltransferase-like protein
MVTVCVSGGFDPLHKGHLAMIDEAATYGKVCVILNSDAWLMRKKGYVFMNFDERKYILSGLRNVHHVTHVEDNDGTVCEALERIRPTCFANGGDRGEKNTPELQLCKDIGIMPLFNMGGGKEASSSELTGRFLRPWGEYRILETDVNFKIKKLIINPQQELSLQSHAQREEHWVIVKGNPTITKGEEIHRYGINDHVHIPVGCRHRISNATDEKIIIIEVQTGSYLGEDDITRYADRYGRVEDENLHSD